MWFQSQAGTEARMITGRRRKTGWRNLEVHQALAVRLTRWHAGSQAHTLTSVDLGRKTGPGAQWQAGAAGLTGWDERIGGGRQVLQASAATRRRKVFAITYQGMQTSAGADAGKKAQI